MAAAHQNGVAVPARAHIFPLRFRQQPVRLACLVGQPRTISPGVVPGNIDDRPSATSPAPIIWPARGQARDALPVAMRLRRVPLLEGNGVAAGRELPNPCIAGTVPTTCSRSEVGGPETLGARQTLIPATLSGTEER
jgi:hypothetical protein